MASKSSHFLLDISKLNFVLKVLRHYKFPEARWFEFGLDLGLLHPTLKAIESANRGDPSNCLMECLAKWLTEGSDHTLVWQTLANALRGMNALAVASNIHKTMADPVSEILQCYIGRLAQVVLTEESVGLLHTEGLISKDTLREVKSCGCSLVGDPMLLILSAVAEDHSKLCTLTSILMKSKEAVSLASDIIMEYEKSFPSAVTVIPSCQQASTSTSSRSGELQDSSSETQVATNTDATAQGVVEVIVHPGYEAEFDRMATLRGNLIHNIVPLIKAAIPSIDDLKTYVRRCRSHLENQLDQAETFDAVIRVIEKECSIVNVSVLEAIVNNYSLQDAGDMILAYQTHLDEFCENKLTMFCDRQLKRLSSSLLTCETIKFVLKWNPDDRSYTNIQALLWKSFQDNQVEVVVIKKWNSIMVTCYAPHYLMESLLVTARDNVDMLKEMGLISLTIGYYTLYDEHAIDEEVKSLMKKLEMVESERDDLFEENAKLKGTIDTLESEKEHNKMMKNKMQMEIDHLRSLLQSKTAPVVTSYHEEEILIQTQDKGKTEVNELTEMLRNDNQHLHYKLAMMKQQLDIVGADKEEALCSKQQLTSELLGMRLQLDHEQTMQKEQIEDMNATNKVLMKKVQSHLEKNAFLQKTISKIESNWIISHEDVTVSKKELGRGSYGVVWVGQFRRRPVAVKELHEAIRSLNNAEIFHQEINTMSQLRHPNLLQFIGAVLDHPSGYPLIITEVMDTSLRSAYERKELTTDPGCRPVILSIMRDVAVGLNYLHCLPDPIIHRDVSSTNVLLESKGDNIWKTKISDFGSAKVANKAVSPAPGALAYSAPEVLFSIMSSDSNKKPQTTKMDVFSYGVLLCEIITCRFPYQLDAFKGMLHQVQSISSRPIGTSDTQGFLLHSLIVLCCHDDPSKRPSMSQIIEQIDVISM